MPISTIFYNEVAFDEGFKISALPKEDRLVRGRRVSACSGISLFQNIYSKGCKITCYSCGAEADRWIADKGKKDHNSPPVLNLYGVHNGKIVLFTRDHIIPKSLGGVDDIENLRPACDICNSQRGNTLSESELVFRQQNAHLVCEKRLAHGVKTVRTYIQSLCTMKKPGVDNIIKEAKKPFEMIGVEI